MADVARTLVELLRLGADPSSPDLRCSLARVELARARALLELHEPAQSLEACGIASDLLAPGPESEAERLLPEVAALEVRAWLLLGQPDRGGQILAEALKDADPSDAPNPIRASLLVLAARVSKGPAQIVALEVAHAYLAKAEAAGCDFTQRWAALELARAKILAPGDPVGARLAFAAARGRLEAALEVGRNDLFVPLLRVYGAELDLLPSEGEAEWVRLDRVLRVACRALEREPATASQRRAWQGLLASPPAQTAIRTAPSPLRTTARELAEFLGQPTPHPLAEEDAPLVLSP